MRITENHLHPYGGFVIGDAGGTEAQRSTFWGIGNRMKPGAAAFAAGYSAGSTTGGEQFVAIGQNATGESRFISIGCSATAGTNYSTALGYQSKALAGGAMAIGGYKAEASGVSAIAVGMFSLASGVSSVAVAGRASAVGENAIAVGTYAFADTSAVGVGATARAMDSSVAIGQYSGAALGAALSGATKTIPADGNYYFGTGSFTVNGNSLRPSAVHALKTGDVITSAGQVFPAPASLVNSIAIGSRANVDGPDQIQFGDNTRTFTKVGVGDDRLIPVKELQALVAGAADWSTFQAAIAAL